MIGSNPGYLFRSFLVYSLKKNQLNGRNVSFPGRKIEQHNKEQITINLQEGQGEVLFRALQKT